MACTFASATARADVRTEARRYFEKGMGLIEEGRYEEGIAQLQKAYDTLPHPNVLYNIGRAHAEAGNLEQGVEYLERYLETNPDDREEVRGVVEGLREEIEQREPEPAPVAPEAADAELEPPPVASQEEIQALEESAEQLEELAAASESEALARRAERLRALASQLRERAREQPDGAAPGPDEEPAETQEGAEQKTEEAQAEAAGEGEGVEIEEEGDEGIYEETVTAASRFEQSPIEAPSATSNITRQDVRLTGHRNIGELVRRVAGADVMRLTASDTQIGIRGFNQRLSNRVLVLVNGRSVYLDPLGTTFWAILPYGAEDVERIEVIRGPASALYGADAFSGIINVITRPPGPESTGFKLGVGNAGQLLGRVWTSGRVDRFAYRISTGYGQADSFSRELDPDRVDRSASPVFDPDQGGLGYKRAYVNGAFSYELHPDVTAKLEAGVNDNRQEFQGTGPLRELVAEGPLGHVMAELDTSWGRVRAFWNHLDATAAPSHFPTGGDPLRTDFVWNTVDVEAELIQDFHLLVDHNLHLGASYRLKTIDWDFLDDHHTENHYAVFFQDTMRVLDPLILVGSFRVDFHPLIDDPIFSPRGAVIVKPNEDSAVRLSTATAFRTQTFLESYLDLRLPTPVDGVDAIGQGSETAGTELDPESILSVELGYRNAQSDYFDVDTAVYYNQVSDLIVLSQLEPFSLSDFADPASSAGYDPAVSGFPIGATSFTNDPTEFDVVGGEIGTRVYPVRGLDVYANYAINEAFIRNEEQSARESEERTSMHKVNAGVQYRSSFGLDLAVDFHWVSDQVWLEQDFDRVSGVVFREFPLDSYYLLNARAGYRLLEDKLELAVTGYNLTDNRHRQHPFGQVLSLRVIGSAAYQF